MKCIACPIAGPCMGERSEHGYACRVDPKAESFLRWMASASATPQPEDMTQVMNHAISDRQGMEIVEDRPTAAESLTLLRAARECPQRAKPACSCTFAHCRLDGRDKSSSECLTCIRDRLNDLPASSPEGGYFSIGQTKLNMRT